MSTHDLDIANAAGASFRADLNLALVALARKMDAASASDPSTTYPYQDRVDTTNFVLKRRNAANNGWIDKETIDEAFVVSRSSNTIMGRSDRGKSFVATAGFTQTFDAAATLGDGWGINYRVESGATLVLDPNSAETVDGAATKSIVGPASGSIFCNGSSFFTFGFGAYVDQTQTFSKAQRASITGLTDAATIATDMSLNNDFSVTLGGNRTFGQPTNIVAGQKGSFYITQDGTGSRTAAFHSYFKFEGGTAPTLTTTAGAIDRLDYAVKSTTEIHARIALDVK